MLSTGGVASVLAMHRQVNYRDNQPKEITPMAWKMPPLIVRSGRVNFPRSELGVSIP